MPSLCGPPGRARRSGLSGCVRSQKRQDGLGELARPDLGKGMAAARKNLNFSPGDQTRKLFGKISRRDEVVLGADDQGRCLDARQAFGTVESEDRVDPAGGNLGRRKDRQVLRLQLPQALVVARDPPTWIEEQRVGLDVGARAETQEDILAQSEQPA